MKKIVYEVPVTASGRKTTMVRIGTNIYTQITKISRATRMPICKIVDDLLAAALEDVELVEVPLYEMKMREEAGKDE